MSWNYRVMAHCEGAEEYYAVHEVFYNDECKVIAWTQEPIAPLGHSKEDILQVLRVMLKDCENQEVLEYGMEAEGSFEDDMEDEDYCPQCGSSRMRMEIGTPFWQCADCLYVEYDEEVIQDE